MASELVEQWLEKSKDDYISATVLMEKVVPPQIEIACYHCQQCADKIPEQYRNLGIRSKICSCFIKASV